jgi:hypothetical protein
VKRQPDTRTYPSQHDRRDPASEADPRRFR